MIDHDAVERLERLIATQRPASVPWAPVTDYSVAARDQVERPHAERIVAHLLPAPDARVLDFGCGPDAHLVRNLRGAISRADLEASVVGYDPQIGYSHQYLLWTYDLVICREVLEHLTVVELTRTVRRLCEYSKQLVYVTTRFNPAPSHLLDVMTSDDLDPTHISMTNKEFLRMLFVLEGFRRRSDLERLMDWRSYGRVLVYERP